VVVLLYCRFCGYTSENPETIRAHLLHRHGAAYSPRDKPPTPENRKRRCAAIYNCAECYPRCCDKGYCNEKNKTHEQE
jgi:hypothetical protein